MRKYFYLFFVAPRVGGNGKKGPVVSFFLDAFILRAYLFLSPHSIINDFILKAKRPLLFREYSRYVIFDCRSKPTTDKGTGVAGKPNGVSNARSTDLGECHCLIVSGPTGSMATEHVSSALRVTYSLSGF